MEPQLLLPKSNEGKNNNILSKNTTMLNNKKQNKKGKYDNNKSPYDSPDYRLSDDKK